MGRVIKVDGKFNPILVSEFTLSLPDDCRIVCLTSRDVTVIRKALIPMYWATRYGEFISPGAFELSDNSDLIELLEELEVKLMANCYDGLRAIADSIALLARSQCCDTVNVVTDGNSGVNGSVDDTFVTYGTEPYSTTPVTLPEGYVDEAAYLAEKCAVANAIATAIIDVVRNFGAIATFEAIASTAVLIVGAWGILVLPAVVIPTLVAAIAVSWLVSGSLLALSIELQNRKQDMICAMYTSTSESEAIDWLIDVFNAAVDALAENPATSAAMRTILAILVNQDTLKRLFSEYVGFSLPSAEGLCDECGEDLVRIPIYCEGTEYETIEGIIESGNLAGGPVTLGSVLVNYRCNTGYYDYDTAIAVAEPGVAFYFEWSYTQNVNTLVCCEWMDENGQNHLVANAENVTQPLLARLIRIRCNNPAFPSFSCTYSWTIP